MIIKGSVVHVTITWIKSQWNTQYWPGFILEPKFISIIYKTEYIEA